MSWLHMHVGRMCIFLCREHPTRRVLGIIGRSDGRLRTPRGRHRSSPCSPDRVAPHGLPQTHLTPIRIYPAPSAQLSPGRGPDNRGDAQTGDSQGEPVSQAPLVDNTSAASPSVVRIRRIHTSVTMRAIPRPEMHKASRSRKNSCTSLP